MHVIFGLFDVFNQRFEFFMTVRINLDFVMFRQNRIVSHKQSSDGLPCLIRQQIAWH